MAPALTKVLKEGHGIHLSSPLSSGRVDSNGRAVCRTELEPAMKSTEDADPQTLWLNFSLFPSLESWLATGPLNIPADPLPSPHLQTSAAQCESVLPSSSASLPGLLSMNEEEVGASHQGGSVLPGAPDMSLGPVPEHNSQTTCQLHGPDTAHECEPDGGDVHCSPFTLTSISSSCSLGEFKSQGCTSSSAHRPQTLIEEKAVQEACAPSAPVQSCSGRLNFDRLAFIALLEEELQRWQTGLHSQAWRQRAPYFPLFDSSTVSSYFNEVSCSSQAVLGGLQGASDSEATASSSSDDELEEKKSSPTSSSSSSSSCESRWLEERAELSSRWSWLQLRLSELEGRIQQLVELHKHIRSSKGGVVLAPAQTQAQQIQLEKVAKFSCSDSDADAETCSPTRLLHNIARQSAQVSSLIPPLSFSPPSKQAQTCTGSRTFTSGLKGGDVFVPGSLKRRRLLTTRTSRADASWCCARTRPLLTYYKPKLFVFNSCNPSNPQGGDKSASSLLSSPSCSCCSSGDPAVLCSDPGCSSSLALSSRKHSTRPHPVLSLPFDTHLVHHFQRTPAREEWSLTPLIINAQSPTPAHHTRFTSTPLADSHKYRQHARYKNRDISLSPVRMAASAQSERRRASRRKRKRRPIRRSIKDEDDVLEQPCELMDCSYKGPIRKSPVESVYSSDNIVIRLSVSKVEQLQYKDILTPRWRVLSTRSLTENQARDEEVEDLSDEVFARRHEALEQSEKLRWSSWGKRKCCRRPTRSGSRLSGSGGELCTSAEESSVERAGAQLGPDEQLSSGEWLPRTPWERRAFPLDEDEEEALLCDRLENVASGWSLLSPSQSSGAILPSGAQNGSITSNCS